MSIRLIATISAMTFATALTVTAQTPNPQQPTDRQRPTTETQGRENTSDQPVTVTGCLQAEKNVPGPDASATEGAGESYVLTNVKMSQGATTSGLGLAAKYQIKGGLVKDSEIKNHLGHQVEVMGRLQSNNGSRGNATGTAHNTGNDNKSNLPNLQATSLKMISQTCAAQ